MGKQINVKDVDPKLLEEAKIKAIREGRNLSDVIREMLKNWVKHEPKPAPK